MQLTTFSDLGLRVLMLLAAQRIADVAAEKPTTIAQLAEQLNASRNHIAKVVQTLSSAGLLESIRGRRGGVHITDKGMSASVGELLRELEGTKEVVDCVGAMGCPLASRDCALRHRLAAAQEAFFATLDGDTVGDLARATAPLVAEVAQGPVLLADPQVRAKD